LYVAGIVQLVFADSSPPVIMCDKEQAIYGWIKSMERTTEILPVEMANGKVVQVQVTTMGGEEDIAILDHLPTFEEVTGAIEEISRAITSSIEKVKPQRASVEFGLEVAVQEGKLTALLVQGSGTASVTITLGWGSE
jgi:hypothetical protein